MSLLKISGGTVYDPANRIDGQIRDLWIDDGRIVAAPTDPSVRPARVIDVRRIGRHAGRHRHALPHRRAEGEHGPQAAARGKARGRTGAPHRALTRSGTMGSVPSTFATGYKYAALGYTTAFDAAIPAAGRPARPRRIRRHALPGQGLLRPDGQQPLHHAAPSSGASTSELKAFIGLAAVGGQGLRAEAGQSRRRRGLEEPGLGQRHALDRRRRTVRRHAAADHRRPLPQAVDELQLPHARAHPRQQPGPARQLDHDAGNDAGCWKGIAAT